MRKIILILLGGITFCVSQMMAQPINQEGAERKAKQYCAEIENIANASSPQEIIMKASGNLRKLSELSGDTALYVIEDLGNENKNWKYRYALLQYIALEKEKRAVPTVIKIAKDRREPAKLRASACAVLGELGDKKAVPALKESLRDKDREVKRGAAVALGKIGDQSADRDLIDAFESESDNTVKVDLLRGLTGANNKNSIKFIGKILLNKDEDQVVRGMAAIALGKVGGDDAVKTLAKVLDENNSLVSVNAVIGLGHTKSAEAVSVLEKSLENRDLAPFVLGALSAIGDEKAFQIIKEVADSSQDEILRETAKRIVAGGVTK